jgi:hypothetical protein
MGHFQSKLHELADGLEARRLSPAEQHDRKPNVKWTRNTQVCGGKTGSDAFVHGYENSVAREVPGIEMSLDAAA